MNNEEAKNFLIDISYKLGNMGIEYLTEKDGEKMREAVEVLWQEPKSEWQHDHEILKAYSDGANEMLDKIRNEVCDIDDEIVLNPDSFYERKVYVRFCKVIDIIDKYKAESEEQK